MGEGKRHAPIKKDSKPSRIINEKNTDGVNYTNCSMDESNEPPMMVGGESIQYTDQYSFMNDDDHYNSNYLKDFKRVQKQGTMQSLQVNNLSKLPSF